MTLAIKRLHSRQAENFSSVSGPIPIIDYLIRIRSVDNIRIIVAARRAG
jgi:hypothetical protein